MVQLKNNLSLLLPALLLLLAFPGCADEMAEITWWDLLSPTERVFYEKIDPFNAPDDTEFPPVLPNKKWDGKKVKIPGYMVNLDGSYKETTNFLIVPYGGACVHIPPPPENQIIYGISDKKITFDLYTPLWVYGRLKVSAFTNEYAQGLYTLIVDRAEVYIVN